MQKFITYLCKIGFSALVLFFASTSFAQRPTNNYDKLALQYFDQKEFEKANVYFEDLYDKNPDNWFYYYFKSLLGAKDYTRAEKITKKQLKQNKYNIHFNIYLARIYKLQNDTKKETEFNEKALKDLVTTQPYLQYVVTAFVEDEHYDYAIEAYKKARKNSPDYPYYYEIADLYKQKNDLKAMINEYLDALEFRESELNTVQTNLQNSLGYDDNDGGINNPLLKQELQKRIQKNSDKIALSEFLIFIQKQQKDFDGAFIQSKALDKRLKEEGQRIYALAKICESNQQWQTAQRCYQYILEKGASNGYYDAATIDILNVNYLSITQKPQPTNEELLTLEQNYIKANQKFKNTSLNVQIIKNLANLQAYYLNKENNAIDLLDEAINSTGIDVVAKANYKLQLADIYLLNGQIWDASLLYSQVEKDFKYEAIGQEAKFKNAKLSFYAGDFKWAKTQADVLKGATTKLIANDALDLSLIITDAIGVDTTDLPLKLFASAELMILQHKYSPAIIRMDSINQLFSTNTLGDDIYYKKAQIYLLLGDYVKAEAMYANIIEYYPNDLYADDAQFKLAELYEKTGNKEKAKQTYQDMLTKYPGSIYVVEARKRFRLLRGDALSN